MPTRFILSIECKVFVRKDSPENQSALVELEKNSEKCRFENFVGG
jgi:hypothetical protein